jgi:2,3-dihydroxy-p-cumate/2,3-dihydroxybenzoate 3,4-dioxygenase
VIGLRDIRYVRLGTRDVDAASRYATSILGLEGAGSEDPSDHAIGFDVRDAAALDAAAAEIDAHDLPVAWGTRAECEARRVERLLRFSDPSGNAIELVHGARPSERPHVPGREAGITGFSHIGLRTTDAVRDEAFWTRVCNARVSDRIGTAPLLRIDAVHHRLALFPSARAGVQHVNHQVAGIDDVMRAYYFLRERGVRIVFGPGRHPTSSAVFLYFEGPDGMVYEYSTGVRLIEDEASHRPRQFPFEPASFCMWGSRPDIPEFR